MSVLSFTTNDTARNGEMLSLTMCSLLDVRHLMALHPSEHQEQIGFLSWFRKTFPRVLIFAIPNGGKRNIGVARKLKDEGVVAGVPDLFIPQWNLWVEMKTIKGRLSSEQREVIERLEHANHTVVIGQGAMDASRQVLQHIVDMKASRGLQ
jgi:hypothetical protein